MAHVQKNKLPSAFSGTLGDEIVFREWEGKTIVARVPKERKGEPTQSQAEIQEKFLLATKYAKAVLAGQVVGMKDAYAGVLRPRQNIYSRALEDFMSSPVVKSIDTRNYKGVVGDKLTIRAFDDYRVTGVQVQITAANGTLLEQGNAQVQPNGLDYTYTATLANAQLAGSKIKAIATDVPGNEGSLEVTL